MTKICGNLYLNTDRIAQYYLRLCPISSRWKPSSRQLRRPRLRHYRSVRRELDRVASDLPGAGLRRTGGPGARLTCLTARMLEALGRKMPSISDAHVPQGRRHGGYLTVSRRSRSRLALLGVDRHRVKHRGQRLRDRHDEHALVAPLGFALAERNDRFKSSAHLGSTSP